MAAPCTILGKPQLDDVQVLSSNSYPATTTTPAHHSVIVGCSPRKEKTTGAAMLGQFRKAGIDPKMKVVEFAITEDAIVPAGQSTVCLCRVGGEPGLMSARSFVRSLAGTTISAAHFVPGQHVDVQAPSYVELLP